MKEKLNTASPCRESFAPKEPFDLKRAMAGEQICTRDGRAVKFIAYNLDATPGMQIVTFSNEYKPAGYAFHSIDGKWTDRLKEHSADLFMAALNQEAINAGMSWEEKILKDDIKASGLKIGDKVNINGLESVDSSGFLFRWDDKVEFSPLEVLDFEYFGNRSCLRVYLGWHFGAKYFPLSQWKAKESTIEKEEVSHV